MRLVTDIKEIVEKVEERSMGLCEVCYSPGTDYHHVIHGRGKRTQHQNQYSVKLLCKECHQGTRGVHGRDGHELDLRLKKELQEQYKELGYNEYEIRELMGGKIYI